jgi:hypothetical protein
MFLTYREVRSGGEALNPEQSFSDYAPEYIEWSPRRLFINRPADEWQIETINTDFEVKPSDKVVLTVVRYQTGCTFGTTHGSWQIIGAYKTREDAQAIADIIQVDENKNREYENARREHWYRGEKHPVNLPEDLYKGYKPWRGFFENLENIEVIDMVVE